MPIHPSFRRFPTEPYLLSKELVRMYQDLYTWSYFEDWYDVSSFSNSWVNAGGNYNDAGYCKDPFGNVHLRGNIKDGTLGSAAFTLPSGYRPEAYLRIATVSSGPAISYLEIEADGDVIPTGGSNTWLSLDGVYFRAYP